MFEIKKYFIVLIVLLLMFLLCTINAQDSTQTNQEEVVPDSLVALHIMNKFVEATGGKENYLGIKDRTTIMSGKMMDHAFTVTIFQKSPDKLRQEIQVGPATQTFIYDGTNAVTVMGDNVAPIKDYELERTRLEAQMNFLLGPKKYGISPEFLGTEMVDTLNCFKISLSNDTAYTWIQYYDVHSSLKIKELRTVVAQQGKFVQASFYDDYRDIDGIKYPFRIRQSMGIQNLVMNVVSIKVNTGLKNNLFEIPEE